MFDDIRFAWGGRDHVIPAARVLKAIATVERHLTLHELSTYLARGTAPMALVSEAYAALINFAAAGRAQVTPEEVYEAMFDTDAQTRVLDALQMLLVLLTPKKAIAPPLAPVRPGFRSPGGKARSKRSTKR